MATEAPGTPMRFPQVEAILSACRSLEAEINRRLLAAVDLGYSSYQILAVLAGQPQLRLRMSELAAAVGLSRSCLSHAVNRVEERGWVRRENSRRDGHRDGRGVDAVLTDDGQTVLAAAANVYALAVRDLVHDRLPPDLLHSLHRAALALGIGAEPLPWRRAS